MKKALSLLLVLTLVLSLSACGGAEESSATPTDPTQAQSGGDQEQSPSDTPEGAAGLGNAGEAIDKETHEYTEITIGSVGDKFIGHFDPTGGYSTDTSCSSRTLVYDHAFEIDPETKEWYSNIFDEYSFDEETCVATCHVKNGVVFYRNQEQMLASDILYSFQCNSISPRTAGTWAQWIVFDDCYVSDDDMTLYMQFTAPYGMWEYQLGQSGILDKSWVDEHGGFDSFDWFDIDLVNGSGPYYPTEFTIGISTSYEKVENWWGDDLCTTAYCYADKINCLQYSDETSMMVDYENKVLDMVLSISAQSFDRVLASPDTLGTAQSTSSNCVAAISLNHDTLYGTELLDNEDLRKAICYGADWDALAELAYGSLYTPASSVLPSSMQFSVSGCSYEYDPEYAKECLDASGLAGSTLTWVANSGTTAATIAEAFQAYMGDLGLNIDVEIYDTLTCISLWETPNATDFQLCNNNNANTSGDAYELVRNFSSDTSFYCNNRQDPEFNEMVEASICTTDDALRAEYFAEIQEYIFNDYSIIPICEWNVALAYHDTIVSTRLTDVYQPDLRYIGF